MGWGDFMSEPNVILIVEASERNRSFLNELFNEEYKMLFGTELSNAVKVLQENASDISAILVSYDIHIPFLAFLENQKELEQIPIILLYNEQNTFDNRFIYSIKNHNIADSICLPLNPYAIKRRVENLIEFFQQKNALEKLVRSQTEHILAQNDRLRKQQEKIANINNDMLDTLSTIIEYRDVESGKHIFRIRKFTEILLSAVAQKCPEYQLTDEKIRLISSAASMHDIGKIAIPDSILLSPKRLSHDEFKLMKTHTVKGCEILESIDNIEHNEYYTYCYQICRFHHEKWDGMGYPDGLSGDDIPICAQVVAVADCYDALTSKRPYKDAYSHEKAVDMIRSGACGAFSEKLMECFSTVLPQFKEWAERYMDGTPKSASNITEDSESSSIDAFYAKMSRNDLINALEHQKEVSKETHKRDCEIIYHINDIVFECNLKHDSFYDRKNNWLDIFDCYPKNYMEAVSQIQENCHPNDRQKFLETFRTENLYNTVISHQRKVVLDCRLKLDDSDYQWVKCTVIPFLSEDGSKVQQLIFSVMLLDFDPLMFKNCGSEQCDEITGLWNLDYMKNLVNDYIAHSGKNGVHAMLYINIDNFKKINMLTGEHIYDDLLSDIASVIQAQSPLNSVVGKGHSDSFILFIKDYSDKLELLSIAEYFSRSLRKTYTYNGLETPSLSVSIGIARYPFDGSLFEELLENSGCAAEYACHNGSDMYLFYNSNMKSIWNMKLYSGMILEKEPVKLIDYQEFFYPVVNVRNAAVESYDFFELPGDSPFDLNIEDIFESLVHSDRATLLSMRTLRNLIYHLYQIEQKGYTLPPVSLYTVFMAHDRADTENILSIVTQITEKYPLQSKDVCIFLAQDMFTFLSLKDIIAFVEGIRSLGFKVGLFRFGMNTINIKCLTDRLFDKVVFSGSFINDISTGVYPIELLIYLTDYFSKLGTSVHFPDYIQTEIINTLTSKTKSSFFVYAKPQINVEQFSAMLYHNKTKPPYPLLEHNRSELVLAIDMYNEILEKTHCVVFEWNPVTDTVRFSESYEKIYHAKPITKNFLYAAETSIKFHKDDRKAFVEKLIFAKEGNICGDILIRCRLGNKKDRFRINKVKLVPVKNDMGITTKVIGIMMDVSEEISGNSYNCKTDRVTTLYSRHGAENRIKTFLCGDGITGVHAMFAMEIENINEVANLLGNIFYEAVLKENALKLKEIFRDSDIVGRMDGGHFIIFLKNIHNADILFSKADTICEILKNSYQFNQETIDICANVGISVYPLDGTSYEELYSHAYSALNNAKHNDNKKWCMYNSTINGDIQNSLIDT